MEFRWNQFMYEFLLSSNDQCEGKRLLDLGCVLLRLAWNFSRRDENIELSNVEMLDVLSTVVKSANDINENNNSDRKSTFSIPARSSSNTRSEWYFLKGKELITMNSNKISVTNRILWLKTCKKLFKSSLKNQDLLDEWICVDSNIYLAAMYYAFDMNHEKAHKFSRKVVLLKR